MPRSTEKMKAMGERIKARRLELGLSQEELAIRCGYVDRSSISRMEKGGNALNAESAAKVATALMTTVNYIFGIPEESDGRLEQLVKLLNPQQRKIAQKMIEAMLENEE